RCCQRAPPAGHPVASTAGTLVAMDGRTGLRVLVAHDGSDKSERAIRLLESAAWPEGTSFELIGATQGTRPFLVPQPPALLVDPRTRDAIERSARETGEQALEAAARRLRTAGHQADWQLIEGEPVQTVLDVARAVEPDLLVTGSRDPGTVEATLGTSFAREVFLQAGCAVLVARREALEPAILMEDPSLGTDGARPLTGRHEPEGSPLAGFLGQMLPADGEQPPGDQPPGVERVARLVEERGINTIALPVPRAPQDRDFATELFRLASCSLLAIPVDPAA
ncbi:MAG TPA: universal stress protein, partial [Vitreimonas sp.]|nr:universal stress protein [Vitreimonas sp.]